MSSISWNPLAYARAQMGTSLAFHIVFAAVGVALPAFMVIADLLHRRTGDADYLHLSKRLAKGTSILFAVGAVSGTVLSFELGLLWPRFMGTFGEAIGLPFALEGIAFFTEAIFLGIYLYGRGRVSPNVHLAAGIGVALSGAASAFFVTLVNAFMNGPALPGPDGFDPLVVLDQINYTGAGSQVVSQLSNGPVEWLDRWQKKGDRSGRQRLTTLTPDVPGADAAVALGRHSSSDANVRDASYGRLKTRRAGGLW